MSEGKGKRGEVKELGPGGVQQYLIEQVVLHGGMAEHFTSPGKKFVPDLIITWPNYSFAAIHFVETKTIGGKLESGQVRDHERRRKLGAHVFTIWTKTQVDTYIREHGKQALYYLGKLKREEIPFG